MPFDYDSFVAGVITGYKLHRPPESRNPPAPSGRYILPENGEKIMENGEKIIPDLPVSANANIHSSAFSVGQAPSVSKVSGAWQDLIGTDVNLGS